MDSCIVTTGDQGDGPTSGVMDRPYLPLLCAVVKVVNHSEVYKVLGG